MASRCQAARAVQTPCRSRYSLCLQPLNSVTRLSMRRGLTLAPALDTEAGVCGGFCGDSSGSGLEPMTTRITQIKEQSGGEAILKVEGSLTIEDARLLEKVCHNLREQQGGGVRINVAGLSFLDDESASLLCRLRGLPGVELEGAHLFIMEVIERAERNGLAG